MSKNKQVVGPSVIRVAAGVRAAREKALLSF